MLKFKLSIVSMAWHLIKHKYMFMFLYYAYVSSDIARQIMYWLYLQVDQTSNSEGTIIFFQGILNIVMVL
jgi:hypothetical protein